MSNAEPETAAAKPRSSLLGRLFIAGFMGCVVAAECLFAYFWLPSASEVAAQVEQIAEEAKAALRQTRKTTQKRQRRQLRSTWGNSPLPTIGCRRKPRFARISTCMAPWARRNRRNSRSYLPATRQRFRDQVIVEIRNCEVSDLEDPGLGLIKRRFLEKSNALLGKPLLRSIIFADYTFVEL